MSGRTGTRRAAATMVIGLLGLLGGDAWAEGPQRARDTRSDSASTSRSSGSRSGSDASSSRRSDAGGAAAKSSVATRPTDRQRPQDGPVRIEHDRRDGRRDGVPVRRWIDPGPGWYSWWWAPGFYGPYVGWGWWSWWSASPPYGHYRGSRGARNQGIGALDLDVSPEEAEVFVDGERVGIADNFDGFPQYLWLPEGTYDVAFYHPGRRTLVRQYTIYPGLVIDVEDRLEEGEAVRPEDLAATETDRREARQRRNVERRREARDRAPEDWRRRRVEREREPRPEVDDPEETSSSVGEGDETAESAVHEIARLRLEVEPGDASIYLDGRFLGTAEELSALRSGLAVEPGGHVVQVVRPGYEPVEERFVVEADEVIELELELEAR